VKFDAVPERTTLPALLLWLWLETTL